MPPFQLTLAALLTTILSAISALRSFSNLNLSAWSGDSAFKPELAAGSWARGCADASPSDAKFDVSSELGYVVLLFRRSSFPAAFLLRVSDVLSSRAIVTTVTLRAFCSNR